MFKLSIFAPYTPHLKFLFDIPYYFATQLTMPPLVPVIKAKIIALTYLTIITVSLYRWLCAPYVDELLDV